MTTKAVKEQAQIVSERLSYHFRSVPSGWNIPEGHPYMKEFLNAVEKLCIFCKELPADGKDYKSNLETQPTELSKVSPKALETSETEESSLSNSSAASAIIKSPKKETLDCIVVPCGEYIYEFVNLGLPSGTFWADKNLRAKTPEESGWYFQWGDNTGYAKEDIGKLREFNWESYPFYEGGKLSKYTKNGDVLAKEDDVVTIYLGENYSIPTREQFQELLNKCEWAWDINKKGYVVKGPNGNRIFLPASGVASDGGVSAVGQYGDYWSSSLDADNAQYAYYLGFNSGGQSVGYGGRFFGLSIRPCTKCTNK